MKLLSNVSLFLVALALVSLAGCASFFGEGWNPADATASVDGSGHDGSTVGETDAGSKTDATSADSQADGSDAAGQDSGTDVATTEEVDTAKPPFCPQPGDPAEATLEIQLADGPQCFVPGAEETTMVLAFINAPMDPGGFGHPDANLMPAAPVDGNGGGGCATIHDESYCFPIAKVYGKGYKPKWADLLGDNVGKNFLVVKYPDTSIFPEGGKELVIVGCSLGVCTLSSVFDDGSYNDAEYQISKKILTISWYDKKIHTYTDEYKLE